MKRPLALAMLLAACSGPEQPQNGSPTVVPAEGLSLPNSPAAKPKAMVLPIPQETAQRERLLAMGYKVHEDHLDPPGVASCPKMSENPVL
jgi:hypothetical protein